MWTCFPTLSPTCHLMIMQFLFVFAAVEPSADDLYIPHFNGLNSYIKLPCLENVRRGFSIEIWFLAETLNGVLLYNGQLHNRRGDFISVNLVNGHVQFRYDLGSGIANITWVCGIILLLFYSQRVWFRSNTQLSSTNCKMHK